MAGLLGGARGDCMCCKDIFGCLSSPFVLQRLERRVPLTGPQRRLGE